MAVKDASEVRSIQDLPSLHERWTASKKALVVDAIRFGKITREEALKHYCMLEEELQSWERDLKVFGQKGLSVSRIKEHRKTYRKR